MLLRKLAGSLLRQDWMAVAIEFVIVVVGVFVGIQVSNWNADRVDQRRAHGYLQRIHADLVTDRQSMTNAVAYWRQVIGFGAAAIAYADEGRLVDGSRWKTVVTFYQASQMRPFRMVDSTYQELVNSGDLGLLRDDHLRSSLADYYVSGPVVSAPYILQYVPEYRHLVRGQTPDAVSEYIWKRCVANVGGLEEDLSTECETPITEAEAQAVLDGYLATPGLLTALRFWVTNQRVGVALLSNVRDDSPALLREVEASLGR
jgi:hypothetical protein